MLDQKIMDRIQKLKDRYPSKDSALMPALMLAQKANGNYLSEEDMNEVSKFVGVTSGKAYGVATYYTMYNTKKVGKFHIQVDTNIPATLAGAVKILEFVKKELGINPGESTKDGLFTLNEVECLASCGTCPVIQVNDTYFENMTTEKTKNLIDSLKKGVMPKPEEPVYYGGTECNVLLKNRRLKNSTSIEVYKKNGGYKALAKAQSMEPKDILNEVKISAIRGRGGAGFPAGVKWGFLAKGTGKPIYLICNADEGEPGTFKDRQIMEYDPHLLIEGMIISAKSIGSKLGFIYIRGEFDWIADILDKAIDEAKADGQMKDFDIIVHRGAGAYVCGEETALIESIEGKRGQPRMKPPFPAVAGLYGCPTIVNNVETLASVPFIIEKGADEFKNYGYENNTGFKLFGISGCVNKPGVYEFPLGVPFSKILEAAGGAKGKLKAVIVGGLSVPILKADELEGLNMDYDACIKKGTMLGSGGIMVISEEFSIPEIAYRTIKFYAHESCGKCTPCKEGSYTIVKILEKLLKGKAKQEDLDNMMRVITSVNEGGSTLCPTGQAFAMPIKAMYEKFKDEFQKLIK
ncbi:MAG TPA: NADH-quinone oxidoreductase subunit NuoF [Clostridiales bacterium]|nr:NADH-quinone oxidoreductase subunit NuoF [Clostridiales bacterium]HQP69761.1 NADH-quinone oxidoreductase subunit NuoF [Clostridiales bacterium]